MKLNGLIILLICFFLSLSSSAQNDSLNTHVEPLKIHSPKKAAILSAVLPGSGQFYNKKYWKIPIVYAGLGTGAFFINYSNQKYQFYREQYLIKSGSITGIPLDPALALWPESLIKSTRDSYRRDMEISYIVTGLWYIINILDATVDAHLFDFNIDEDLSMRVNPYFNKVVGQHTYQGVGLTFYLK